MADTEKLGVKVFLQPAIDTKEWSQKTLQSLIGDKKFSVKVSQLTPTADAIKGLRTAIETGLSGVNLDLKVGNGKSTTNSIASVNSEMTKMQTQVSAAMKMVEGLNSEYGTLLRTVGTTKGTVNSMRTPVDNMVNSYHQLQVAIAKVNADQNTTGQEFIQEVTGYAHAFQQDATYAQQYVDALKQLQSAQNTLKVAQTNGFGNTEQVKALSVSMENLKSVITQVEKSGDSMGQKLSTSLLSATDSVKNAQSSWRSASKSMTTDMSGVQKTMQDIGTLMGSVTDQKQIDTLNSFNDQLKAMQQAGVADTKALDSMNKELVKMTSADNGSTKEISADLRAAQEAAEAFRNTYDTTMKSMGRNGITNTEVGTIHNYTTAWEALGKAMDSAASTSKTGAQYISKISDQAAAFDQSTKHVEQYRDAMEQLSKARQTILTADQQGIGEAKQLDDLRNNVEALQGSLQELDNAGVTATQDMYDGLSMATEATAKAQKSWNQMAKYITSDMTGVNQALQKANSLITSGQITDPQQLATLTGYVNQLKQMQDSGAANTKVLGDIAKGISKIEKQATPATSALKNMVTQFKNMATSMVESMVIRQVFSTIQKGIKQVISTVKELDSAMTQLEIVTGASATELSQYFDAAAESAKTYGASITDIVGSMETFARLGYNLQDSLNLTNTATLMSNVAATSVDEATTGLTSIVKAYGIEASEASNVADELIAVGQSYAISAEELMTAFEKGGAALAAANNSIEESIALFAAANASVQNANNVGTALRTTSARIRSATAELDEMGEEYDQLVASSADYRAEIMALSGVDIMQSEDELKPVLLKPAQIGKHPEKDNSEGKA